MNHGQSLHETRRESRRLLEEQKKFGDLHLGFYDEISDTGAANNFNTDKLMDLMRVGSLSGEELEKEIGFTGTRNLKSENDDSESEEDWVPDFVVKSDVDFCFNYDKFAQSVEVWKAQYVTNIDRDNDSKRRSSAKTNSKYGTASTIELSYRLSTGLLPSERLKPDSDIVAKSDDTAAASSVQIISGSDSDAESEGFKTYEARSSIPDIASVQPYYNGFSRLLPPKDSSIRTRKNLKS